MPAGDRQYGLGPRSVPQLNLRGMVVEAVVPLLFSTAGYGEYHAAPGTYVFNMSGPDRYRIQSRSPGLLDYVFSYGPTPKEIYEELSMSGTAVLCPPPQRPEASWQGLREALWRLLHASWSGLLEPSLDESAFREAAPELRVRAGQLASLINAGGRADLKAYSTVYRQEIRERGIPTVRPLPMQFPTDAEAARHSDVFMFGDELLAAPLLGPGRRRALYLPMGTWTRLDTGETHAGRQTVTVESDGLILFSRNGMIVPLQSTALELHYFPRLAAEFFLYEEQSGEYSQVHAAPAGDILRLEIESAVEREYEWVAHHTARPRRVASGEAVFAEAAQPALLGHGKWHYDDARRTLRVRVRAAPGEDRVVSVSFD
jgi:hypothetical protein